MPKALRRRRHHPCLVPRPPAWPMAAAPICSRPKGRPTLAAAARSVWFPGCRRGPSAGALTTTTAGRCAHAGAHPGRRQDPNQARPNPSKSSSPQHQLERRGGARPRSRRGPSAASSLHGRSPSQRREPMAPVLLVLCTWGLIVILHFDSGVYT